jgi:lysozyme
MSADAARRLVVAHGVTGPAILGQRGYYENTMGAPGKNDRGIFDDMIAVVTPRTYRTFNANTDPSAADTGTRLATLQPGVWDFKLGLHHPDTANEYPCLVQAGPVTVLRDNGVRETGEFYIHIHHGGLNTTTSEGCQTIYLAQWPEFFQLVKTEMQFYKLTEIPYVLTVREDE